MIIFLYGGDSFRSQQKLLEIKQKYLQSDKSGSGLSSFDFSNKTSAGAVLDVLEIPNLLAPKRLVIVKDIISLASVQDQKCLWEHFKKRIKYIGSDNDLIIVFWESSRPKKSSSLFKFLSENSKKQDFEKLSGAKLNRWIVENLKKINSSYSLSKIALAKLIAYTDGDSRLLNSEIEKLASFTGGKMISGEDVDNLVKANIDSNIFATIDAIGANNKKEAVGLIAKHWEKGDDPFYIFSMFLYQFRNLLKIADFKEKNVNNEYEISRLTKLHPFVVKKSLSQIRNLTLEKLKSLYKKLGDLDTQIKTGKIEIKLALDKFVAEL